MQVFFKANLPDAVCRDLMLLTPETIHACLEAKQVRLHLLPDIYVCVCVCVCVYV